MQQGCGIDRSFYISSDDLLEEIGDFDEQYGAPYNLYERLLASYPSVAIAAEFKRASPSKGDINIKVNIVDQCLMYAEAGAAVVSVLTEYRHFKGVSLIANTLVKYYLQKKISQELWTT